MRTHLPRLAAAALAFALGVASVSLLNVGEEASVNVPEPPTSAAPRPAPVPETCELHHSAMRDYCLPFTEAFKPANTLSSRHAEQKLFPNAFSRRAGAGVCEARGEGAVRFYACPACRAALRKWKAGGLRP